MRISTMLSEIGQSQKDAFPDIKQPFTQNTKQIDTRVNYVLKKSYPAETR